VAVCNQKGGVGKSTTTINLDAALADQGRKMLLVDFDPQGALSVGLGIKACQAGHRVLSATAAAWTDRLTAAHRAGRLQAEITRLGRYPLLIIDEIGYIPFESEAANLFFQLISARYETASVIVTSNKPFSKAHMFAATCVRQQLK